MKRFNELFNEHTGEGIIKWSNYDDIYDKQMNLVNQLQRQYDVRSKYANPSSTGIQGLIAEPIVSQPQTGYNNINEIMRRYI